MCGLRGRRRIRPSPSTARRHIVSTSSSEPDDESADLDANTADVAEQHTPVDPALEKADAALDEDFPDDADPADVAEQRREVPPEDPEP
jgi:hypothetical protein